ncbi:MAG: hypothetical protein F4018_13775, partial [Acidobacteria bacterium]|nr:hypothetical protein [Acidobacteriota bacterium]
MAVGRRVRLLRHAGLARLAGSLLAGSLLTGIAPAEASQAAVAAAPTALVQAPRAVGAAPAAAAPDDHAALVQRYCVTCHNGRLRTAGLALDAVEVTAEHVAAHPELWERVVQKLRSRTMPPAGRPRPAGAAYSAFASWLET